MYNFETYSEEGIFIEAKKFAEEEELPLTSVEDAINVYINAKPGTWRLISHNTALKNTCLVYQFTWSTGEE